MKISIVLATLLLCFSTSLRAQVADHVVISEFATQGQSSGQDEFVELYNPTSFDRALHRWILQYKTATGTTWNDKAVLPPAALIPAHGYYLIASTAYLGTTLPDYASSLWTALSPISFVGNLRIVDLDSLEIDKVGFGSTADDPEGSPVPGAGSGNQSVERKALMTSTADSLSPGGRHYLAGNGYDSNDNGNDFVLQTHGRSPQNTQSVPEPAFGVEGNGTGNVTVNPIRVYAGRSTALVFNLKGDSGYVLNMIKCAVPAGWGWSHNVDSVVLSGSAFDTATTSIDGDTIVITQASVSSSDIATISINGLTAPSSGGTSVFKFFTAVSGGTPAQILISPSIVVTPIVPIVSVHVNDVQGVCAMPYSVGAQVSVSGTVTANISETQTNVFIQDGTGGINIFNAGRPIDFHLGDSLLLTGTIVQFRGLTEISPDFSTLIVIDTGKLLPAPEVLTCSLVNQTFEPDYSEPNEGKLIRINGVSYNSANSTITDATGTTAIFIPSSFPPTPSVFDMIGILKQFKPGTRPPPPYTQDYEITPRFPGDIIGHPGPIIIRTPVEDSILSSMVRISWGTDVSSSSIVYFGTDLYTDTVTNVTPTVEHSVWLSGLSPATFYHYAVGSEDSNGTTIVGDFLMSTSSPGGTTGQINVYFNRNVDTTVSSGESALGGQDLTSRFVERINTARHAIDACFYNLSGLPGATVASALVSARDRGVIVRVICEEDNRSNAPFNTLASNGIPVITDAFDVLNAGVGLMHDKFAVIDFKGGAPESVWVWTGSWNPTDQGTNSDRQNSLELQDVSLAHVYTAEFEEMWGSSTPIPNASVSRFGSHKLNITPHLFNVAGNSVQCYFSPSDRTSAQIGKAFSMATKSISGAIYTFTRKDLGDSLIAQRNRGRTIRVVMDNNSDLGTQYSYLQSNGVDVHLKGFSGGLLHHKYAIIDATQLGGTQWVVTGSHNWSSSAETVNDENTLIIQSNRVANLYLQEFAARYTEAGGTNRIVLGVKEIPGGIPKAYALSQNYPNPFNPSTGIRFSIPRTAYVVLKIYNILGEVIATLVEGTKSAGTYEVEWNASRYSSGVYFYRITSKDFVDTRKMILLK